MVLVSLKVVTLEQAKAFWEVVTSNTILGQKLVEKIKCSNPFSPEINFVAVVDIAKEAGFRFTVDEVFEVIYGSEGQRPWDNDDIWFDEAASFVYASGSIAFDITVNKDVAIKSNIPPLDFFDGCVW